MIYKFFTPQLALQGYVKEFLLLHFKFDGLSVNPVRPYNPQPEQCLTFDPKGHLTAINKQTGETEQRGSSYFSGQQVSCYDLHFDQDYLMLKVIFQPGALFKLFGIPLNEFNGKYVDAETVANQEIRSINEQLANTEDYLKMIAIVERYLLLKVLLLKPQIQRIDHLTNILNNQPTAFSLKWFAEQSCLSPRQFERKFIERIGIGANLYSRLARYDKAFKMKEAHPELSWFAIAITCGYYDYQHLNKDFRQFTAVPPSILLKDQTQVTEKLLKLI